MAEDPDGAAGDPCSDALERLYEFLDGELTPERRQALAEHLDRCPPCLDHKDFEADLRALVAHCCQERVPESLRQRVAQALEAERSG